MKHERNTLRNAGIIHALLVFGAFGSIGVLIDLDHIPVLLQKGLPITAENLINHAGRILHIPVFILVGVLCLISLALVYRYGDRPL
jgi:hypothetical protein